MFCFFNFFLLFSNCILHLIMIINEQRNRYECCLHDRNVEKRFSVTNQSIDKSFGPLSGIFLTIIELPPLSLSTNNFSSPSFPGKNHKRSGTNKENNLHLDPFG